MPDVQDDWAVVVGSRGFIARHVVTALRARGERVHEVRGLAAANSTAAWPERVRTVFYLAGGVTPASAESDPESASREYQSFCEFLTNVSKRDDMPTIAFASSGGTVYSRTTPPPYREESLVAPVCRYGRMKAAMESRLQLVADRTRPVILRLGNVYGPGQLPRSGLGVIAHWLNATRLGQSIPMLGDPGATRDYLYIGDLVAALILVHERSPTTCLPPVMNIGSGHPTSLAELAGRVAACVGGELRFEAQPSRSFDRSDVWLDSSLARAELGWSAATGLDAGVARTWEWWSSRDASAGLNMPPGVAGQILYPTNVPTPDRIFQARSHRRE